jgi:drug/metabolite transporter (DMT)-like permease
MKSTNKNIVGVLSLVLGIFIFSLQDITVKKMGGSYPILEIVILRTLIAIPLTLILYRMEGQRGLPRTKQPRLEILRGALLFLSYTTYFMGLASLPLAEISAIKFSTPLMITLLSVMLLGEKVGYKKWIALVVGFIGVLIIIRPDSAHFNIGSIFILMNVVFYVLSVMVTRRLQTTESSATMGYFSTFVYLAFSAVLAPIVIAIGPMPNADPSIAFLFHAWSMPSWLDLLVIFGLAVIWAGGMFFIAKAYSLATASVVAPFEYMSLPINTTWGLILWHQFPSWVTLVGAALTMGSSLYSLILGQREKKKVKISLEEEIANFEHELD